MPVDVTTQVELMRLRAVLRSLAERLDEIVCRTQNERDREELSALAEEAERAADG